MPTVLAEAIMQSRKDNADLAAGCASAAKTKGQRELQKKHGTPKAFAEACINAIGEISVLEAMTAIQRYNKQWAAA
jgi:hypothetical protein